MCKPNFRFVRWPENAGTCCLAHLTAYCYCVSYLRWHRKILQVGRGYTSGAWLKAPLCSLHRKDPDLWTEG